MTIENKPFARFRNEAQGLSFHYPAHWSCSIIHTKNENRALVEDGPLANLSITCFSLDEFNSKWNISPRNPIEALNPYLVYTNRKDSKIHGILDESAIKGQDAFSLTYRDRSGNSEAGKRKVAIFHQQQIAIIEAEWETRQHQSWISTIIASIEISPPPAPTTFCLLKIRNLVTIVDRQEIHELSLPYPRSWSLEYQPASVGQTARFSLKSGRFSFHYFLNKAPGAEGAPLKFDDLIEIERKAMGLAEEPAWEGVQAEEKRTAVHPFPGGTEAVVSQGSQTLYLLTEVGQADFVRDLISGVVLTSEPAPTEKDSVLTCLESISIQAAPDGTAQSGAVGENYYYTLTVDKQEPAADGIDEVTAVLSARNGEWRPVAGKAITIKTQPEIDVRQLSQITSEDGSLTAVLKSSNPTDVSVFAVNEANAPVTSETVVSFMPPPNQYQLNVDKTEVWADGQESVQLLVTALSAQGKPLPGQEIHIQSDPEIAIDQSQLITNKAGEVHGTITFSDSGVFVVFASDGLGKQITSGQTITAVPPIDPQNSKMIIEEEAEQPVGEDVVNVLLLVRDSQGQPLAHRAVTIKTTPAIDTLQPTAVTDANGCLRATLRSDKPVTVNVRAIETERQFLITEMDLRIVPPPVPSQRKIKRPRPNISESESPLPAATIPAGQPPVQETMPAAAVQPEASAGSRPAGRQRWRAWF